MLTEQEWIRRSSQRRRRHALCWGALYVTHASPRHPLLYDRAFQAFLFLLSCTVALLLPFFCPPAAQEAFSDSPVVQQEETTQPRNVRAVSYQLPQELRYEQRTFTKDQLMRGKLLLLDQHHPLPSDAPYPNTFSIAATARGAVPVDNLQIVSGKGTIEALKELFSDLRKKGINGLMVCDGTRSPAQQQERRETFLRTLLSRQTLAQALEQTNLLYDQPGIGEMQQEYTVEIRPHAEAAPHAWQQLLQTAWRYGFVRTESTGEERDAYRFRWVGEAHATAMTYLALSFRDYLFWLHEKGMLVIRENGSIKYLIFCKAFSGTHIAFSLPAEAEVEVSLDNMGYAIAACIIK